MNITISLCQTHTSKIKEECFKSTLKALKKAGTRKSDLVILPEMWNSPYTPKYLKLNAEKEYGESYQLLKNAAKKYGYYLVGGSIPVIRNEKIYNTSYVFDREGNEIGATDKKHLFDVDLGGKYSIRESATISAGNGGLVVDTEFGKIGVAICYDVRFPEYIKELTKKGARIIALPAAFNLKTGPVHWELTARGRAMDNQVYFAAVAPSRDQTLGYVTYGHSILVDPWGQTVGKLGYSNGVLTETVNLDYVDEVRRKLPIL